MVKNVLFLDTVITLYKGAAKELQSCAQEMGFGWPDVFIIGMAFEWSVKSNLEELL